jgi:hypothetical protein
MRKRRYRLAHSELDIRYDNRTLKNMQLLTQVILLNNVRLRGCRQKIFSAFRSGGDNQFIFELGTSNMEDRRLTNTATHT